MDLRTLTKKKPETDLNRYQFTIYGAPGIGKTSFACEFFEDPLFLAWEDGIKEQEAYVVPMKTWKDTLDFLKQLRQLKKEEFDFPWKNIVIDTIELMRDACEVYVCKQNGWESPSDGDYGQGWAQVRRELENRIKEMQDLGFGVHYIAHDKTVQIKQKNNVQYDKRTPMIGGSAVSLVVKNPDFVLLFDKEYQGHDENLAVERVIRIDAGELYDSKSRIGGMPEKITCGKSAKETAQIVKDLIKTQFEKMSADTKEEPKTPPKKAEKEKTPSPDTPTPEELEELEALGKKMVDEGKITPQELGRMVQQYAVVKKFKDITSKKTVEVLKNAMEFVNESL